jgi:bifunctional ADP-heptose synthase (sugar kinase/adenylyltransferase)
VLILEFESERLIPGGGANSVANVTALGGKALPLGVVGDDESGRALRNEFERRGIALDGIVEVPDFKTPTKTRILGGGSHGIKQQIVRFDIEDHVALDRNISDTWNRALDNWSGLEPPVAVLSDYGYGAVTPELVDRLAEALPSRPIVLCDSRYRLGDFAGISGATPNEEEAEVLAGESLGDDFSAQISF